jgi:hypothetical protein
MKLSKLLLSAMVFEAMRPNVAAPTWWDTGPECVRDVLRELGLTTPWSVRDWYEAMNWAVEHVVEQRRHMLLPEQRVALRGQLFEMLGKLTKEETDAVVRLALTLGYGSMGMGMAADVFVVVLDAKLGPAEQLPEVSEHWPDFGMPPMPEPPAALEHVGAHGWTMGRRLARRLGVRR